MGRNRINTIQSTFNEIYNFINYQPGATLGELYTTGGIAFHCDARVTRDNRRFISLPHSNRIYEADWGYYFNGMGKEGQRIGQYSIPINIRYIQSKKV